jgi:hypothetical protein
MRRTRRYAAATAGVVSALALAAPIAGAGAATTPTAFPGFSLPTFAQLPAFAVLPAFSGVPLSFVYPSAAFVGFAKGPTVIGSIANGATVVQVVNGGPAESSVIGSP